MEEEEEEWEETEEEKKKKNKEEEKKKEEKPHIMEQYKQHEGYVDNYDRMAYSYLMS
jgi:hypothetical protein